MGAGVLYCREVVAWGGVGGAGGLRKGGGGGLNWGSDTGTGWGGGQTGGGVGRSLHNSLPFIRQIFDIKDFMPPSGEARKEFNKPKVFIVL